MIEIAKCPGCAKKIYESHENAWCHNCGDQLPDDIRHRLPRLASLAGDPAASGGVDTVAAHAASSPVVTRYTDAYRVGAALIGLGDSIKIIGAILAGVTFFGASVAGSPGAGIVCGGIMGLLSWICGVMVAALGQVLRATLDTAVASSPFLTNAERAATMGLPPTVVVRSQV